jgi:hypothetical protein
MQTRKRKPKHTKSYFMYEVVLLFLLVMHVGKLNGVLLSMSFYNNPVFNS